MVEPRWTVELWNINEGGSLNFEDKKNALDVYNSKKLQVKKEFPEYKWVEEKQGNELHFFSLDGNGERLVLGDMEAY